LGHFSRLDFSERAVPGMFQQTVCQIVSDFRPSGTGGTRRRKLISLGIDPAEVHTASRSRKGYWRMSQMSLVRHALNNRWLEEQGVPDMRTVWIKLHYGPDARV
jgi:hypothetical protein